MNATVFSGKIVEWYREHHRSLPWRKTRDPYKIWLSEIILQQTRVAQGLPYYRAFVKKYPTVQALASAREQEVLRLWQGLGYYSRARNLHACAKHVVSELGGKFPQNFDQLRKLRGIGDYTAAAIASIAFNQQVAAIDGNVYRVLARIFGLSVNIQTPAGKRVFFEHANRLVPSGQPGIHNQALMEFGALHCVPRNPKCAECTFQSFCIARRTRMQQVLPVKSKVRKVTRRNFYYVVIRRGNSLLMKMRSGRDIWKGLWDFPLHEGRARLVEKQFRQLLPAALRSGDLKISPVFRQTLTHQVIHARFLELQLSTRIRLPADRLFQNSRFVTAKKVLEIPKPVLISQFLTANGMT